MQTSPRSQLHASQLVPPVKIEVVRWDEAGREESLGTGTLVDVLEIGSPIQICLGAKTLRTTPLAAIVPLDANAIEIRTANHSYRLVRPSPARAELMATTRGRLEQLRARGRRDPSARRLQTGLTGTGNVATPRQAGSGAFCSGAPVRVTRVRTDDAILEACGSLGAGRLLDDLRIGACARFSLDDGSTLATSPVRSLQRMGPTRVQVATGNSIYRFDLLQ